MGILIAIEANDGAGKATQSQLLYDFLREKGVKVRKISFPDYDSKSSELAKMYLNGEFGTNSQDVSAYAASVFFACDRFASYRTKWKDFYEEGGVIISDRYTTSNIAHQAQKIEGYEDRIQFAAWLKEFEYEIMGIPKPDLVIYLDILPEISLRTIAKRSNKIDQSDVKDIHERDFEHIQKAYDIAHELMENEGWHCVKCYEGKDYRPQEEIRDDILEIIGKQYDLWSS